MAVPGVNDLRLVKPESQQQTTIQPADENAKLFLEFDPGTATMTKDGQALVFTFDDGSSIRVEGFYDTFTSKTPPTFVLGDAEIDAQTFFAANEDLMPAAGPAAAAATGGRYNEFGNANLMDGNDALGGLDPGRNPGFDPEVPYGGGGDAFLPAGGAFSLDVANGGSIIGVAGGLYEDNRPNQHLGGTDDVLATPRLEINFTGTAGTVLDSIDVRGFTPGTVITIGGVETTINSLDQLVNFTPGQIANGVFITPSPNDDTDMTLSYQANIRNPLSGATNIIGGSTVIVVDAVADRPEDIATETGDVALDGAITVTEQSVKQGYEAGWAKDELSKDNSVVDAGAVRVESVKFSTTVTFGDYGENDPTDTGELHYVLIEAPKGWQCEYTAGLYAERITLQCDAEGKPLVDQNQTGDMEKDFFQVPVDNADILNKGENGIITVDVTLSGPATNSTDTTLPLWTGGMAVETDTDGELRLDNNSAYNFSDEQSALRLDTIDSVLNVQVGWASEGNAPDKNLKPGEAQGNQWTEGDASDATRGADGARLTLSIDSTNADARGEYISQAAFKLPAGSLFAGDTEIADGTNFSVDFGDGPCLLHAEMNPEGYLVITGFPAGTTSLDNLNLHFVPDVTGREYRDDDLSFDYKVTVTSEDTSASAVFSGGSVIVVDAVADRAGDGLATIGNGGTSLTATDTSEADKTIDSTNADRPIEAADNPGTGWETDFYKLNYKEVEYSFKVTASSEFPDHDGSEKHYILIEKPGGSWELAEPLSLGYSLVPGDNEYTDGVDTYYKIQVDDSLLSEGYSGKAELTVEFKATGIVGDTKVDLKTGSIAEEKADLQVNAGDSGSEYDLANNTAVNIDGQAVTYEIDVINSGLTVKTGWASEGNNDAKHLKADASGNYKVSGSYVGSTANTTTTGSTNVGAPIVFTLDGSEGSFEYIDSITLTFDASRGDLYLNGLKVDLSGGVVDADTGKTTITLSTGTGPGQSPNLTDILGTNGNGGLVFRPLDTGDARFDYTDVTLEYKVTVSNEAGATATFEGDSRIVIDAVADRPVATGNAAKTEYPLTDPDDPSSGQASAKPGDEVTVHGTVTFPDTSGGEEHYILIPVPGTAAGNYSVGSVTVAYGSESHVYDGLTAVSIPGQSGSYYKIPLTDFTHDDQDGNKIESFEVSININAPTADTTGTYDVKFGGMATVDGGSVLGGDDSESKNYEFDKVNNTAINFDGSVKITVDGVESKLVMSVGSAFENAHKDANDGFIPRGQLTVEQIQKGSAEISFKGLVAHEILTGFVIRFDCLKDAGGEYIQNTGGFMYGNTLMDMDNPGPYSINGVTFTYAYDEDSGQVTLTAIAGDGGYPTGDTLYFVPGETYSSLDIPLEYAAVVQDTNNGYNKPFCSDYSSGGVSLNGENLLGDLYENLGIKNDPNSISQTPGKQPGGDLLVEVDAVAQQADLGEISANGELHDNADGAVDVDGDGRYDYVVPGKTANISIPVNFHGDVADGSEHHYLFIEMKAGWNLPYNSNGTITISINGVPVDISAGDIQQQRIDLGNGTSTYWKIEIPNASLSASQGDVTIDIGMQSPTNAGADAILKIGVGTLEDSRIVSQDNEADYQNNNAFDYGEVKINFDHSGGAGAENGYYFEQSKEEAHLGSNFEQAAVPITIAIAKPGDHVDAITIQSAPGSEDLGTLYILTHEGYEAYKGARESYESEWESWNSGGGQGPEPRAPEVKDPLFGGREIVTGENLASGDNLTADGKFTGQVVFVPNGEAHHSEDYTYDYHVTTRDPNSGDITNTDKQGTIIGDSVAQLPEGIDVSDGKFTEYSQTLPFSVSGTFTDLDGSSSHYLVVEAVPNWGFAYVDKSGNTVNLEFKDTLVAPDGKLYYKIPVNDLFTEADKTAGKGEVTVQVQITSPEYQKWIDPQGSIQVGGLSIENNVTTGGDKELTWHNNTAFAKDDGTNIGFGLEHDNGPGGNGGLVLGGSLYENNTPDAHTGDPTPKLATLEIGAKDEATSIEITIPADEAGKVVAELFDAQGIKLSGHENGDGSVTYIIDKDDDGKFPGLQIGVSEDYKNRDEDFDIRYQYKDENSQNLGGVGSERIVVDAVAQQGSIDHIKGYDVQDPDTWNRVAGVDNPESRFEIAVKFEDFDGSEKHFILVEKIPGWEVEGATDTFFYEGKTYYRIDVSDLKPDDDGLVRYEVTAKYNGSDLSILHLGASPNKDGVLEFSLSTGTMTQETGMGDSDNQEFRFDNNSSINLEGEGKVAFSTIDSSPKFTLQADPVDEHDGSGVPVDIKFTPPTDGMHDELSNLKFTYDDTKGTLYINGVKVTSDEVLTDAQMQALHASGKLTYEPNAFVHDDPKITWNCTIKDQVSGDVKNPGGTITIAIDAVANGSDNTVTTKDISGSYEAVQNGENAVITITTQFTDTVNESEEHWVVISQDPAYKLVSVTLDGDDYDLDKVTLKYGEDGKPYYAIRVEQGNDHTVTFTVNTPNVKEDTQFNDLRAGTITVETTRDGEFSLDNNWKENIEPVVVNTGVIDTTAVVGGNYTVSEYNPDAPTEVGLNLTLTGGHNEVITKLVFANAPGALGHFEYDGVPIPLDGGKPTITDPDGIDMGKLVFVPNDYASGSYNTGFTATVVDTLSGATKDFQVNNGNSNQISVTVNPIATTPTDLTVTPQGFDESGGIFTLALKAIFPDHDGSEQHFFLVKVIDGLTLKGDYTTVSAAAMDLAGSDSYYLIPASADSKIADPSMDLHFIAQPGYVPGTEFEVYATARETGAADGYKIAHSDSTSVSIEDTGSFNHYTVTVDDSGVFDARVLDMGVHVTGSDGADSIYGSDHADTITGGAGDDLLFGGGGNDTIHGGAGNDFLHGGLGANALFGGEGNDILVFSADNIQHDGGDGLDILVGGSGTTFDAMANSAAGIEVFLTTDKDPLDLTNLDAFKDLGIQVNNDDSVLLDAELWTRVEEVQSGENVFVHFQSDDGDLYVLQHLVSNQAG